MKLPVREAKVVVVHVYADHVRKELEPLAFGMKARGFSDDEIADRIEELRPAFDNGVEDLLMQVTIAGLREGVCDDGWAELSVPMLRRALARPQANPAILIKELARGLQLMEAAGVYERDGKLYLPNIEPQSPVVTAAQTAGTHGA